MHVVIKGVKTGTDTLIPVNVDADGNVIVVICGQQADGTVTPLKCDEAGQLVTVAGT